MVLRLSPSGPLVEASGSSEPLSLAYYADPDTLVAPADQNGFIGAPFSSLASAFAAASAIFASDAVMPVLILSPGSYASFSTTGGSEPVILEGLAGAGTPTPPTIVGNVTADAGSTLNLVNLDLQANVTGLVSAKLDHCTVGGNVDAPNVDIIDCPSIAIVENVSILNARYSTLGSINALSLLGSFDFCTLSDIDAPGASLVIQNCIFTGTNTVTCGALTIDSQSYKRALQRNVTFTLSGALTFSDQPLSATISIVVPAVAADAVGYVNTSLVGTPLEDLFDTNDPVLVNPQSDLVAAGAGGGFINARISAANTLRTAFNGALAGGAANFTVTRIG